MLLLVHGEVTDPEVDMFDREAVFIQQKLVRSRGGCVLSCVYVLPVLWCANCVCMCVFQVCVVCLLHIS